MVLLLTFLRMMMCDDANSDEYIIILHLSSDSDTTRTICVSLDGFSESIK